MEKNDYFSSYSVVSAKPPKKDVKTTKNKKKNEQNDDAKSCCKCFSAKTRKNTKNFFTGLATNLGICVLLFGYTLIGSVIFLTIEGGSVYQYQQILATTSNSNLRSPTIEKNLTTSSSRIFAKNEKARAKTVENIWDITYSLNILYRDNWTRLAAMEITRFQNELLKNMAEESKMSKRRDSVTKSDGDDDVVDEWTFAKAFLYSLTVLTTIGYGNTAPHTSLGKIVTMVYALFGIPLTLLYLSSIGAILSRVARGVFSRALCCCLCSNCGYCCYDEKKMQEKERRKKRKRQQMELLAQQQQLTEPYYVLRNVDNVDCDNLSTETQVSVHGCSILAPILLCLCAMFIYICFGTFFLFKFQRWNLLDGFYFCFMSLTTISFPYQNGGDNFWFFSVYIMSGMALTAMCFNVVHDEIIGRLRNSSGSSGGGGGVMSRDVTSS